VNITQLRCVAVGGETGVMVVIQATGSWWVKSGECIQPHVIRLYCKSRTQPRSDYLNSRRNVSEKSAWPYRLTMILD
jgi:hypothetical protein